MPPARRPSSARRIAPIMAGAAAAVARAANPKGGFTRAVHGADAAAQFGLGAMDWLKTKTGFQPRNAEPNFRQHSNEEHLDFRVKASVHGSIEPISFKTASELLYSDHFYKQAGLESEEVKAFFQEFVKKLAPDERHALIDLMSKNLGMVGSQKLLYLLVKWPEFAQALESEAKVDRKGFYRKLLTNPDFASKNVEHFFAMLEELEEQKKMMEKAMAAQK